MRIIKFRAWDKEKKEMDMYAHNRSWFGPSVSIGNNVRYEVMQYTGLKDKGGQDWYEGDILENDTEWWQVVWDEDQAQWQCQPITKGTCWIALSEVADAQDTNHCGNIYENPELLTNN